MRRTVFWMIGIMLFLMIIVPSVWLQIAAEDWRSQQQQRYGVYMDKERCQYKPAIVFYVEERILRRHLDSFDKAMDVYDKAGHSSATTNWWFDNYLYHVFYEGCD